MLIGSPLLAPLATAGILGLAAVLAAVPWGPVATRSRVAALVSAGAAAAAVLLPLAALGIGTAPTWYAAPIAFVGILGAVIQSFGLRQLRREPRQARFATGIPLLTAAVVLVIAAPTILVLAAAWVLVGLALLLLVGMYSDLAQVRRALRHTALSELASTVALGSAVAVVLVAAGGDVAPARLASVAGELPPVTLTVVAVLVVIAGLARSAQVPFHRWLPTTVATPAPVSAIMHAGVVNGMTFLVIAWAPLLGAAPVAMILAFVAGATSMLVGIAGMLVRPDLKGRLVASTTAQMGFMVMTLGVGAFAVALFHLMGHGLYKANLFLRAGSVIDDGRSASVAAPVPRIGLPVLAVALLVPAAAIIPTVFVVADRPSESTLLLAFYGCITGAVLLAVWLSRPHLGRGVRWLGVPAVAVAGIAYAVVVHAGEALLTPPAELAWSVPGVWLAIPLAVVVLLSTVGAAAARRDPRVLGLLLGLAGAPASRRVPRSARSAVRSFSTEEFA